MKIISSFLLVLLFPAAVHAFPELVRHGYTHCTACHTSLTGGGLLNEYGRSLAREILSQQTLAGIPTAEGDEKFLYGLAKTPPWLNMGGDIRLLQAFVESKQASRGRFLIMQVDIDASAQLSDRWRVFASLGRVEPKNSDPTAKDFVASPRHGVEYLISKPDAVDRFALRVGRFMPAYGIGFAEHTFATRRLLDFQPGQERYAYEFSWMNDHTSVIATGILSQADGNGIKSEKGGVIQAATSVGEGSKIGVNYYQSRREMLASSNVFTRRAYGAFAHWAIDKNWYALIEVDRMQDPAGKWGFMDVVKVGREIFQGWQVFAVHEFANTDMDKSNPKFEAYSLGTEWFPRPHWDFYALYRKERNTAINNDFQDVVWLIAHYYL